MVVVVVAISTALSLSALVGTIVVVVVDAQRDSVPPRQYYSSLLPTKTNHRHRSQQNRHRRRQQQQAVGCLTQIGDGLRGTQVLSQFGNTVSISQNGQFVAVGAGLHDGDVAGALLDTGLVQVYESNSNNTSWTQRGTDIEGENADDSLSANALSNDGNILAVGAAATFGPTSGRVQVYRFNSEIGDWQQLGVALTGNGFLDQFGWSVALSGDGIILAVGAIGGGSDSQGQVRAFYWNGSMWINRGSTIDGKKSGTPVGSFGFSISLSESGNILAVGDVYAVDPSNDFNTGSVQVFEFDSNKDNDWNQLGQDLYGTNPADQFGSAVSLSSNGLTAAIGANRAAGTNGIQDGGQVQVYQYNKDGRLWSQLGSSLIGDFANDQLGDSVSLSGDASTLAVGAPFYDNNGSISNDNGLLQIFYWDGTDWQPFGNNIVGCQEFDSLGHAVALSRDGSRVIVGGDTVYFPGRLGLALVMHLEETCIAEDLQKSPTYCALSPSPTEAPSSSPTRPPSLSPSASPVIRPTLTTNPTIPTGLPTLALANASSAPTSLGPSVAPRDQSEGDATRRVGLLVAIAGGVLTFLVLIAGYLGCHHYRKKKKMREARQDPMGQTAHELDNAVEQQESPPGTIVGQVAGVSDVIHVEQQSWGMPPLVKDGVAQLPLSGHTSQDCNENQQGGGHPHAEARMLGTLQDPEVAANLQFKDQTRGDVVAPLEGQSLPDADAIHP